MKITKEIAKKIENKARELVAEYNPYLAESIKYFIDMKPMFLYAGEAMTREEIDNAYLETALKDARKGFEERRAGYYDKYYRYSRTDEGKAYDAGQKIAADNYQCPELTVIECNG